MRTNVGIALSPVVSPAPFTPESKPPPLPLPGLDSEGWLQAIAGTVFALIALLSSDDHITVAGRCYPLQQQWGIWLIAASVALILIDAQLATRSRLRAAHERAQDRDRAAEATERQRQATARQDRCALLCGRLQLDPSPINRERFRAFLALISDAEP